ncbi:hypothetical protein [Methylobacterium aerolatum]|uniref:NTP pyrophosphohydrolase MazG putative catalytic core domain-containing protein n=1 Tax=Methylobacterium aerolatum TaxID=418708 RepID=A0ABU0I845_9HYPH|nr:hypothetical protein [Methylobacterium aerolatum]MDQ0449819.1 hypothetical protein [Methylobacterium aerolatum]GJD36589.1 hypothetical protein FMGBMHLM_3512 [Methylobacterium aerolatum]
MSTDNVQRIADHFTQRLEGLDYVPDGFGMLIELITALARDNAETVFFKVQTEPGWSLEEAQALADKAIYDHVLAIADTVHVNGGTLEMALDLGKVAAETYGARLAELTTSYRQGGRA